MRYLYKILRISAWLLVLATLLVLFSGFLTTKYFLAPRLGYNNAYYFHTVVLPLIFIPLFYFHSLTGILVLISRRQSLNKKFIKIIVSLAWTGILGLFIFLYGAQNPAVKTYNPTSRSSASN